MKRAVFPGSFDPITLGHVDIINRALPLFDEIIVAIGVNAKKNYMFPLDNRLHYIRESFNFTIAGLRLCVTLSTAAILIAVGNVSFVD